MTTDDMDTKQKIVDGMPVPKVPATAWKWPPVWPFPSDAFEIAPQPEAESASFENGYSSEQKTKLSEHISCFVKEGDNILELCSSTSGQGLVEARDRVAFTDGEVGGADPLAPLLQFHNPQFPMEDDKYDLVVVTDGIEALTNPRDVFRECWRVLKPGGRCLVCFSSRPSNLPRKYSPTKTWTTMTSEQKIWIVGSYFQYSAGPGWNAIEGYDVLQTQSGSDSSGSSNRKGDTNDEDNESVVVFSGDNSDGSRDEGFVVQASKLRRLGAQQPTPFEDISYRLLPAKYMEAEDREYSGLRLAADVKKTGDAEERDGLVAAGVAKLPQIYSVLAGVQDSVVPKPAKALLANYLLPTWEDTPGQVQALKQALGVEPADAFWRALSACTGKLPALEKIALLGEVLSCPAGSSSSSSKRESMPQLMTSVIAAVLEKLPPAGEGGGEGEQEEVQAQAERFAARAVVSDYLLRVKPDNKDGDSDNGERLLRYVRGLSASQLKEAVRAALPASTE
jgi:SAM-dependent methyltransferase